MAVNNTLSVAIQVVQGLITNRQEEIYGIDEVYEKDTNKKPQNLYRLYFNLVHNKIVLHSMICSTNTNVSSGIYDVRNTGFWLGLIKFNQNDIEALRDLIKKDKIITIKDDCFQKLPSLIKEAMKLFDKAGKSFNQANNVQKEVSFTICKKCL